jgi:DNA-binding MarR family transcriptional regulator
MNAATHPHSQDLPEGRPADGPEALPERHPGADPSESGRIGLLLRRAHRRAARAFSEQLQPYDLDNRHAAVLLQLAGQGPVTQSDLIVLLGSDKSSMVRTIDELERRGLVRRAPHPTDRRAHAIEATDAGRSLLTEIRSRADAAGRALLDCLTPEQQARLLDLLQTFADAEDPRPANGDYSTTSSTGMLPRVALE